MKDKNSDNAGLKTSLGDILKAQQEKVQDKVEKIAEQVGDREKEELLKIKEKINSFEVPVLDEEELKKSKELTSIKKETAEVVGKKLFELEKAIKEREVKLQDLEFDDAKKRELEGLRMKKEEFEKMANNGNLGPHVAFIVFIEEVKEMKATPENVRRILDGSVERGRLLPPILVPKGWRKGDPLPADVPAETELFFFPNEKGELCIWATKESTSGNKLLLAILREKKEEIRAAAEARVKEEIDSLETRPPGMTFEELLKDGAVGQAKVYLPATQKTRESYLLVARDENSPFVELCRAAGGVKGLVAEIPSEYLQILSSGLKDGKLSIKNEREARGLRNFSNQAVDDLHLVFVILSDALDYERKERAWKERAEKQKAELKDKKEKLAQEASLTPEAFLLERKEGSFFADFGDGRTWQDKETNKKTNDIFCLFERKQESSSDSNIKVANYPGRLAEFFKNCAEFEPEGKNFSGIPHPAGTLLRFLKNQLLRQKEAEEEMKKYAEDLGLPASPPSTEEFSSPPLEKSPSEDNSDGGDGATDESLSGDFENLPQPVLEAVAEILEQAQVGDSITSSQES